MTQNIQSESFIDITYNEGFKKPLKSKKLEKIEKAEALLKLRGAIVKDIKNYPNCPIKISRFQAPLQTLLIVEEKPKNKISFGGFLPVWTFEQAYHLDRGSKIQDQLQQFDKTMDLPSPSVPASFNYPQTGGMISDCHLNNLANELLNNDQ